MIKSVETTKSNQDSSLQHQGQNVHPWQAKLASELHPGGKKRRKSVKRKSNSGKRKHKIGRKTKRRK